MTNKNVTDLSLLGKIVVVVPRFSQWTGTRAMHEGDFSVGLNGKLPPKEVTRSLGLKAIIDTRHLRVFDRIKYRAEALLEGCGVRYLSGWAIPQEKSQEVFQRLDELVDQYEEEKRQFLTQYDSFVQQWANQHQEFSHEILEGKLDENAVAERINADYESFRMQPISSEKAPALVRNLSGGLSSELIASVSKMARIFFKESFLGKTRANRKTVNAVWKIRERLQGLSFLNARLQPLIAKIDEVLVQMPDEGYFSGEPFWKLATLVKTLGDEALLEEIVCGGQVVFSDSENQSSSDLEQKTLDLASGGNLLTKQDDHFDLSVTELQSSPSDDAQEDLKFGDSEQPSHTDPVLTDLDEFLQQNQDERNTVFPLSQESTVNPMAQDLKQDDKSLVDQPEGISSSQKRIEIPEIDVGDGLYF